MVFIFLVKKIPTNYLVHKYYKITFSNLKINFNLVIFYDEKLFQVKGKSEKVSFVFI